MGCRLIAAVWLGILLAGPASGQESGDLDRGLTAAAAGDTEQAVVLLLAARAGGLRPEDDAVAVRGLQQALHQAGYPTGAADGVWRSRTYDAVWRFAIDHCTPQHATLSLCDWLLANGGLDAHGRAMVLVQRGAALLAAGNAAGARADAASAIALDVATGIRSGAESRFLLGVARYGLGDVAAAVADLLAALQSGQAPDEAAQFLKGVLSAAGMLPPDQGSIDRADLVSAADRYLSTIRSP